MAAIRGQRTLTNVTTDVKVRNIAPQITMLQPNRTPFTRFLDKIGAANTDAMKFEHGERDLLKKAVTVNGAIADTTTCSIVLATGDASYVKVNSMLYDKTNGETFGLVTSVNTATDTIVVASRGGFGSTAANIGATDTLIIASEPNEEGVAFGPSISNISTLYTNYCQEFETGIEMSWLQKHTRDYTNPDWKEVMTQAALEHKEKQEQAFFLSRPASGGYSTGPNGQRVYTTGGLKYWIDTYANAANVSTVTGSLTGKKLMDWLKALYVYGDPNQKVVFASPAARQILTGLGSGMVETVRTDDGFGADIKVVNINSYSVKVVEHQMFSRWSTDSTIYCVDLSLVKKRVLSANGMTFDTAWRQNVQAPDLKGQKDVLYTVAGLHVKNINAHGYMTGFST